METTLLRLGLGPTLYCAWASLAIGASLLLGGWSPENQTRLLVLVFLLLQLAARPVVVPVARRLSPRQRFFALALSSAGLVEGFHMISTPVFPSLKVVAGASVLGFVRSWAIDLAFVLPAYWILFELIWWLIHRCRYSFWEYVLIMGFGQMLGDGGLFYFAAAPAMIFFAPFPVTNYHAINALCFVSVDGSGLGAPASRARKLVAIPALVVAYLVCGTVIKLAGRALAFE